MKFENESEKRKFVETMLSKGIDAAKRQKMNGFMVCVKGKTVEVFGENLSPEEIKYLYPEATIIELTKKETDV